MANKLSDDEFLQAYIRPTDGWPTWTYPHTQTTYHLSLISASKLPDADLRACFALIAASSEDDYRLSSIGWRPAAKKPEMRTPGLRYVLVRDAWHQVRAFASLMPTVEAGAPVVYCYEIHLHAELHGGGLGRRLMGYLAAAAEAIPSVEGVMLTCFVRNVRARGFYARLGFEVDGSSPGERRLRGGKVVEPDYVILSRACGAG